MKMNLKYIMSFAVAAMTLASCGTKEIVPEPQPGKNLKTITFTTAICDETKATLGTSDDTNFYADWVNGDKVAVAMFIDGKHYDDDADFEATWSSSNEVFTGEYDADIHNLALQYRAIYPVGESGVIDFGSVREQSGNDYNGNYDVMLSEEVTADLSNSSTKLVFPMHRQTAIAYFHLKSDIDEPVVSAELQVTGGYIAGDILCGQGQIETDGTSDSITISFGDDAPNAQDFKLWYNVLPTTYSSLKLTVKTATHVKVINNTNAGEYKRGALYKVAPSSKVGGWAERDDVAKRGDILWAENFDGVTVSSNDKPTPAQANATVFNGGNVTYTYTAGESATKLYDQNNAGGSAPELLISKNKGHFVVSGIPTGNSTKATLSFKANQNPGVYISPSSTTTGVEFSEATVVGKMHEYDIAIPKGTKTFDLSFDNTASGNTRIDDFELISGVREEQTVSFSSGLVHWEIGSVYAYESSYAPQSLNGANTEVVYTSSDESVIEVTGDGKLLIHKAGTVTITGEAQKTADYKAASDEYELTILDPSAPVTVTLNPGSNGVDENGEAITWSNGVVTSYAIVNGVRFDAILDGGTANDGKYYSSDKTWRFYTQNLCGVKITVPDGYIITEYTVAANTSPTTPDGFTAGTYSDNATKYTADGTESENVSFYRSSSNINIKSIAVTYKQAAELDRIEVSGDYKTAYYTGDEFDKSGVVVTAFYEGVAGGKDVSSKATFSGYDLSTAGNQTVTVSFGGKTATYNIAVTQTIMTGITLGGTYQTDFYVRDPFNYDGLTVQADYNNGSHFDVNTGNVSVTAPDMSEVGNNKTVTVSYTDAAGTTKSNTYTVNVLARTTHSVSVTENSHATITASHVENVEVGTKVTLGYSNVETGYGFVSYSVLDADDSNVTVTENAGVHSFIMPAKDVTVSATFAKVKYDVTVPTSGLPTGCSVSVDKAKAEYGDQVTLTFNPATGYKVTSLTMNSGSELVESISNNQYSFTMPAENVSFAVTFGMINYNVTRASMSNGTVLINSADNNTTANYNEAITITAQPESDDYRLKAGTLKAYLASDVNKTAILFTSGTTFKMPAGDVEVYAEFEEKPNTSTAVYTVKTATSVTTSGVTPTGSSATFNNTYTSNKEQITSGKSQTLTLKGYQGKIVKSITFSMHSNGSAGAGTLSVKAGTTTLASISSATNFNNSAWNGAYTTSYTDVIPSMSNTNYSIKKGEDIVIVIAATTNSLFCEKFSVEYADDPNYEETYGITLTQPTGGKIEAKVNGSAVTSAVANATVTLNVATTPTGKTFSAWKVVKKSGEEITVTGNTFTMPAEDVTVSAAFTGGESDSTTKSITFSSKYNSNTDLNSTNIPIDDNVSVTFANGGGTNPQYYTSGTAVRCYAKNTITISAATGKTITAVKFTYGSSDGSNAITANSGTFKSPDWTGSSNSVTFTIGGSSGNRRISAISVSYK